MHPSTLPAGAGCAPRVVHSAGARWPRPPGTNPVSTLNAEECAPRGQRPDVEDADWSTRVNATASRCRRQSSQTRQPIPSRRPRPPWAQLHAKAGTVTKIPLPWSLSVEGSWVNQAGFRGFMNLPRTGETSRARSRARDAPLRLAKRADVSASVHVCGFKGSVCTERNRAEARLHSYSCRVSAPRADSAGRSHSWRELPNGCWARDKRGTTRRTRCKLRYISGVL